MGYLMFSSGNHPSICSFYPLSWLPIWLPMASLIPDQRFNISKKETKVCQNSHDFITLEHLNKGNLESCKDVQLPPSVKGH